MEITTIEKYKGKSYLVIVDDENYYININVINEYQLKENSEISEEKFEEVIFQNEYRRAKERAFYLLDYRDHSYKEMYEKLIRNYSERTVKAVLEKLIELNLINDSEYAVKYARVLFLNRKLGRYKAYFEMEKKGIDREIIDEVFLEYEDTSEERLYELVKKKYERYLTDEKGRKKVFNALVRKGYSYYEAREIIKKINDEDEDEEY